MDGEAEHNIENCRFTSTISLFMSMHLLSETLGKNHHSLKFFKLIFLVPLISLHVLRGVAQSATLLCTLRSHFSTILFSLLHILSLHIYLSKSDPVVHLLRICVKKGMQLTQLLGCVLDAFWKLSAI